MEEVDPPKENLENVGISLRDAIDYQTMAQTVYQVSSIQEALETDAICNYMAPMGTVHNIDDNDLFKHEDLAIITFRRMVNYVLLEGNLVDIKDKVVSDQDAKEDIQAQVDT